MFSDLNNLRSFYFDEMYLNFNGIFVYNFDCKVIRRINRNLISNFFLIIFYKSQA